VAQKGLFDLRGQHIDEARAAVRRARERGLTVVPTPSALPGPHPRSVSVRGNTIVPVPRGSSPDPAPPHGTRARYNLQRAPCRCSACRQANTVYIRGYRERTRHEGLTPLLAGRDVVEVKVKGRVL
jgi:hypothetical protein